ncbi:hypothetical protein ACFQV2_26855 [Actinokineospora soli]|uniref:Uncharacterized protein n=1 Tax=Actinokineospora soli TaxID=1048753 RepID=A0ABW2TVT4_9PSEU
MSECRSRWSPTSATAGSPYSQARWSSVSPSRSAGRPPHRSQVP